MTVPKIDIDDAVLVDLRALDSIKPATVYYVDEAPMDDTLPSQNGLVVPYVVYHPGSPRASARGRGIISTRLDPVDSYCIVEVVAPNYAIAKDIGAAINDRMMGRVYEGATELVLERQSQFRDVKEERVPPVVYRYALQYGFITNLR